MQRWAFQLVDGTGLESFWNVLKQYHPVIMSDWHCLDCDKYVKSGKRCPGCNSAQNEMPLVLLGDQ
jgi:hypothetical protein